MMKGAHFSSRLLGLALVTSIASASHAVALFSGAEINFQGLFGKSLQYSTNSGGSYSGNQGSGFLNWTNTNASSIANLSNLGGATGGRVNTICGELVYLADPQLVSGYLSSDILLSAGVKRSGGIVADNYNNGGVNSFFHALGTNDTLVASAFQAAVWAGRYGDGTAISDNGSTINVGAFFIRDGGSVGGANWSTFKSKMSGYYTSARNHNFSGVSLFLDATPNGGSQDQHTMSSSAAPVPEPFTMMLAIGGIGTAMARRRRRS